MPDQSDPPAVAMVARPGGRWRTELERISVLCVRGMRRAGEGRRQARALLSLSDHHLKDIGLGRSEVLAIVHGPRAGGRLRRHAPA